MKQTVMAVVTALLFAMPSAQAAEDSATYLLTFVPTWTSESHPLEYPAAPPRAAHFSPLIGATHGADFTLFAPGAKPTPGFELFAERGKHDDLAPEIQAAIQAGKAGSLIQTSEPILGPVLQPVSTTFKADAKNPLASVALMIAPSPDWFAGAAGVELMKDGKWVPTVSVTSNAWDGGGDNGTTYLAENADTSPKQGVKQSDSPHFTPNGQAAPVGVFVFTRISAE